MKCPTCGENTPDAWQRIVVGVTTGDSGRQDAGAVIGLALSGRGATMFELEAPGDPHPHRVQFDRMHCANDACKQLVVRGHDTYTKYVGGAP